MNTRAIIGFAVIFCASLLSYLLVAIIDSLNNSYDITSTSNFENHEKETTCVSCINTNVTLSARDRQNIDLTTEWTGTSTATTDLTTEWTGTSTATTDPVYITPKQGNKMNILFIVSDDMRAQLGCYEGRDYPYKQPEMQTPNLDALAARSLLLKNAFVQYTLCGPSRTSMLTSRRPDTLHVYHNKVYWREKTGNYTTLPQYFKENGYQSLCVGKVFHPKESSGDHDPPSWSKPCSWPENPELDMPMHDIKRNKWFKGVSMNTTRYFPLFDQNSVSQVQAILEQKGNEANNGNPFFLALGFRKPHGPQVCPQSFFDLYDIDTMTPHLTNEELKTIDEDDHAYKLYRRAYYACISYVDSLVGEVLKTLTTTGLHKSTIVSFGADHGFHWGEHGWRGKMTNFDMTTRVPLMIHIPGRTDKGIISDSIVEAVDIFPSIVEAAGLNPIPECGTNPKVELCTEGKSFLSLIDNPHGKVKSEAYSQRSSMHGSRSKMQYSVRTSRFRFSQWTNWKTSDHYTMSDENMELYDHRRDLKEYLNVVDLPEYASIKRILMTHLFEYVRQNK